MGRQITPSEILLKSTITTYSIRDLRDEFIRHGYEVAEHSKWTMRTRESHLKYFVEFCYRVGFTDIRTLSNPIIDEFFVEYRNNPQGNKPRSKATVNTAKRILKVFLRWVDGYKEVNIRANPDTLKLVRVRNRMPQSIPDDSIATVIRETIEEQDALIIATLREAGLRAGEIVEVRVSDLFDRQIVVTAGKDEADRVVNITHGLTKALRRYIKEQGRRDDDFLFQNTYGNYDAKMSPKTVNLRVQRCFRRIAGVQMHIHQLRHSMAVSMLREGADLVTIQTQLGHKDIQTTMTYLRIDDAHYREAYAKSMPVSILNH